MRGISILALALCLGIAACARDNSDANQRSGFYGGISGGLDAP